MATAFVLLVGTGIAVLVVDTNPVNYYTTDAPVARATNIVNEHLGGASMLSVVAEGDIKSPAVIREIDALERHLAEHPRVDVTSSIAKVIKTMNEVMHDDDDAQYRVPDTRDAIAQYFLLYSMSGDPDDFDKLVDFPYQHAQLTVRVNDSSTRAQGEVVQAARRYLEHHPDAPFTLVGGFADLFTELVHHIVYGQVSSLLVSIILVGLLVALLFRSLVAGLLAILPLGMAMLLLFGLMGYTHIELNVATAMLSSIMIGVGVDYTIHFLWRYKDERQRLEPAEAVRVTLTTSGRGIVFNALSVVVGFAVLMLSAFLPVQFFGILVVVSIGACLVGALVILPAVALVFRPGFLEPVPTLGDVSKE